MMVKADSLPADLHQRRASPRYMSVNGIFTCYDKPMMSVRLQRTKDDPLIEVDTIGLKGFSDERL